MVLQRQQSTFGTPEVFASNWLERLRQIKLLRLRIQEESEASSPSHPWPPSSSAEDGACEDFTDYL